MITDIQKLRAVFDDLKIPYKVNETPGVYAPQGESPERRPYDIALEVDEGVGLPDLGIDFYFNANGKFIAHGVWE